MNKAEKYTYHVKAIRYGENDYEYTAVFDQFPQIAGDGYTQKEAIDEALGALNAYIKYCEKNNISIPDPEEERWLDDYSGKITVRMPKSLHRDLFQYSAKDGASMNYIIIDAIRTYLSKESLNVITEEAIRGIKSAENQVIIAAFKGDTYRVSEERESPSQTLADWTRQRIFYKLGGN